MYLQQSPLSLWFWWAIRLIQFWLLCDCIKQLERYRDVIIIMLRIMNAGMNIGTLVPNIDAECHFYLIHITGVNM